MGVDRKRLAEFFTRFSRDRGIAVGKRFVAELKRVVGVQAPTRVTRSGKVVATMKARPYAPPRRVTGKLQDSITLVNTILGCRVRVGASYGMPLDLGTHLPGFPHVFMKRAADNIGIKLKTKY